MERNKYDVAVVGGGPAGSWVAYKLAEREYGVLVVEQKGRLDGPVCCTGIISLECARSFVINESVILRWANSARIILPSGRVLRIWRREPQACIVDRPAFNVALAERAKGRGVEYVLSSRVTGIKVGSKEVRIEVAGQGGGFHVFEARVVVIATGYGSRLVEELGLGKVGDFVMGAQAEVEARDVDEVEVYLGREIAPDFFAWLVPTSTQKALAGLLSRNNPGFHLGKLMTSLVDAGKIASTEAKLSYGGIPLKPLTRTYSERLVVVGSAAGQVKPTTGGGIYYGMLCADIAADVLRQALECDDLSASSLARYEREWKKRLGQELRVGYWARRFYELLSDAQIERIVNIIKSHGIDEALLKADDLSFDWHGSIVLRLLGHRALSEVIKAVKIPLSLGKRGRGADNVQTGGCVRDE